MDDERHAAFLPSGRKEALFMARMNSSLHYFLPLRLVQKNLLDRQKLSFHTN